MMVVKKVKKVQKKQGARAPSAAVSVAVKEYAETLVAIKNQIQEAQVKATLAVNKELIKLYWSIGKTISEKQAVSNWGSGVVERLAKDLKKLFPGLEGFSRANIFRMQAFYAAYEKVAQLVRQLDELPILQIPWGHNVVLMQKLQGQEARLWYAQKTIDNGWSRSVLEMQIESELYKRQGKAITNFAKTLPAPHSDMAQQSLKDPYIFDFLTLHAECVERDIEQAMIENVQKLLLELGKGFAFIGRQYHLEIEETDFYIDLLFYHVKLRCYVVVELKNTAFKPEYAGKLNFYLSAVDDLLRHPDDKPTIGLLLCKTKNNFIAEYALRDIDKPIGVAEYATKMVESLPKNLKSSLPTIEEIEAELKKYEIVAKSEKKRVEKK